MDEVVNFHRQRRLEHVLCMPNHFLSRYVMLAC